MSIEKTSYPASAKRQVYSLPSVDRRARVQSRQNACVTDAMIGDQAVATQRRLFQERLEPVGEDTGVHEHDRFASADCSILQLHPSQGRSLP